MSEGIFRPSDEDMRAYLDGEHGPPSAEAVAIIQAELAEAVRSNEEAGVRRELSEELCPACGGSMRFCECMDDPFAPAEGKCPTCAHSEGYAHG